jgi:hypothetical protein
MRNPNEVKTYTRTTSTEFVVCYVYANDKIAQREANDVRNTYSVVSDSKVEVSGKVITVTQPLQ